jgi:hypothetical protein
MKKLFVALTLSLSALAFAEIELKPAQEEAKEKFENEIADAVKAMNEKCGTKVVVKTDFQNFKEADWSGTSVSSYCVPVAETLAEMCESRPAYKKVLSKKLTGVSCLFAGVKPAKKDDGSSNAATQRNMSFEKGVFTYTMSPVGHANLAENAKATMEKALN